jgi:hypothetical protein
MRAVLGLDAADAGAALLDGISYAKLRRSLSHVGPSYAAALQSQPLRLATTCCGRATHRA